MTPQFADLLAARYIRELEDNQTSTIATIMDLYDTNSDKFGAMKALLDGRMRDCRLNYQTLGEYSKSINDHYKTQGILSFVGKEKYAQFAQKDFTSRPSMRPVRPIRPARSVSVPMAGFGSTPSRSYGFIPRRQFSEGKKKGGFFDFLTAMKKTDEAAAAEPGDAAPSHQGLQTGEAQE